MSYTPARIGGTPSLAALRRRPEPYSLLWVADVTRALDRERVQPEPTPKPGSTSLYDAGAPRTKVRR